jgi:hypothetical protein
MPIIKESCKETDRLKKQKKPLAKGALGNKRITETGVIIF